MDLSKVPPEFMQRMMELIGSGKLQIPPPIFIDMQGEFIEADLKAKTLTAKFPVQERYQNPMGYMQGGMIATAIDNTIGPLSFMAAAPNVTKSLTVDYKRPIPPSIDFITVVARFDGQEGRELTFTAEVLREDGSVLATAVSHNILMRERNE